MGIRRKQSEGSFPAKRHSHWLSAVALAPAIWLTICAGCAVPQPRGAGKLARIVEPTTKRAYWLYLPVDYIRDSASDRQARDWPVVVTFHGMKPFDTANRQAREWQQEADRYGYVVIAPELSAFHIFGEFPLRTINSAFKSDEEATLRIMDHVFRTTRADSDKVLSTSWSSGGYAAHYMLNRHPDRFTCLAVRQSNFSASVLDPDMAKKSIYHPVLILNTQNDFAICKRESKEAVQWYTTQGCKNMYWFIIKDKGHERTPDLAAEFFARITGTPASSPPAVLVSRQAIDGNEEGIAFLSGKLKDIQSPPASGYTSLSSTRMSPINGRVASGGNGAGPYPRPAKPKETLTVTVPKMKSAVPIHTQQHNPLKIRVSSAIGIQPLYLGFSAECPPSWRETADFLWSLDGQTIGKGLNGQKTLADAGEHTLSVVVVTSKGEEFRAERTIRVLPRLDDLNSSSK